MPENLSNSVKIRYPPSKKDLKEVLNKFLEEIEDKGSKIHKIILFGSYSREDFHYGSDVDLLVIKKDTSTIGFDQIYPLLVDISTEFEFSPIIISESRFEEERKKENFFYRSIYENGIELWPNNDFL